ncbi:helix-turn-helix domain-containing protein [Streptomyces sp. NPDC051577]|uniref:helix-turn-helix domain-containing protein n=1 Tax=Streptomyces sp. NPDC051577 TaxID=3155166 RepID=UPI00343F9C14
MTQDVETTSATGETDLPSPKERRRLRETSELTHKRLASTLGVTTNTVRSWENGRAEPRGRKREAYAKLLAHLAAKEAEPAEPPADQAKQQAEQAEKTAAPGATTAEDTKPEAPTTPEAATAEDIAPAPPEVDAGSDAEADTEAGATPASEPARRMAGAVRAFAAGGQGRPAGSPKRPKIAAKRAAKPPASLARHESKIQVKSGSAGGGHPGGAEPPPAPPSGRTRAPEAPAAPAAEVDTAKAEEATAPAAGIEAEEAARDTATPDRVTQAAETDTADDEAGRAEGTEPAAKTEATAQPQEEDPAEEDQTDRKDPAAEATPVPGGALTPAQAFDALYAYAAPALARQTYLLTGRRALSVGAVERAFQNAWERWPEVATDPDPVGWVRAAAYEHALSPWQRLRRAHRNPDQAPVEPADRILMDAMLALPGTHRRTVLLYDGVGLDLPDTAAETEASTPTAGIRLLHAHADLADRIPELAAVPPERHSALLRERLGAVRPPVRLEPRAPSLVRLSCERRARLWSRAAVGLTAVIAVATAYTLTTAPTRYEPPISPGASVSGVPPHSGPQALTERSKELHDTLRFHPAARPDRLAPTVG